MADKQGTSRSTTKFEIIDDADWVTYPCGTCGHAKSTHQGHTHPEGTPAPTHCSQGCGCQEWKPAKAIRSRQRDVEAELAAMLISAEAAEAERDQLRDEKKRGFIEANKRLQCSAEVVRKLTEERDHLTARVAECESAVAVSVAIGAAEQRKRDAEIARRYFFYPWPAEQIREIIAKNIENEGIL